MTPQLLHCKCGGMRISAAFIAASCCLVACIGDASPGGKLGVEAGLDDASADARAASDAASSGPDAESSCQASLTATCSIASCSSTSACCVTSNNGTSCLSSGCGAYPTWECAQPSDCASATLACCVHMSATTTVSSGCPRVAAGAHGATCDAFSGTTPSCNAGDYVACASNADCGGHGVCTPVQLDIGNIVVGLCL